MVDRFSDVLARAAGEKPPRVPSRARAAFRAARWILVLWLCVIGAGWYMDTNGGSWLGSALLVLAVLLMFIGPGVFTSIGGCIAGGVLFMILGTVIFTILHPAQHVVLADRSVTVSATVGQSVRYGVGTGPWVCDGAEPRNHLAIPASAGIGKGCLDVGGLTYPCRRCSAVPLPAGTRLTVLVDPRHQVRPFARYQSARALGTMDYLGLAFILGYPVLIFGVAARTWRKSGLDKLAAWQKNPADAPAEHESDAAPGN